MLAYCYVLGIQVVLYLGLQLMIWRMLQKDEYINWCSDWNIGCPNMVCSRESHPLCCLDTTMIAIIGLKWCPDIGMVLRTLTIPERSCPLRSLDIAANMCSWVWEMSGHGHRYLDINGSKFLTVLGIFRTFLRMQTFYFPDIQTPRSNV
jgi:hypothetical protein